MPTIVIPEPFCYVVFDSDTGQEIGGGNDWSSKPEEAKFQEREEYWSRFYPDRNVHVEQISYADYCKSWGRAVDWESEYVQLLALEGEAS